MDEVYVHAHGGGRDEGDRGGRPLTGGNDVRDVPPVDSFCRARTTNEAAEEEHAHAPVPQRGAVEEVANQLEAAAEEEGRFKRVLCVWVFKCLCWNLC